MRHLHQVFIDDNDLAAKIDKEFIVTEKKYWMITYFQSDRSNKNKESSVKSLLFGWWLWKKWSYEDWKSRKTNKRDKRVCLVATNHPLLQNIGRIFHRHFDLLYTDQEIERVFTSGFMDSFLSSRKISSYLIRAKLYPLEMRVGSFKFRGRRCQVCLNVTETETLLHLTSTSTNQTYKINDEFSCNESSLIYLLTCNLSSLVCWTNSWYLSQ